MTDTFKQQLDAIEAAAPTKVKIDPGSLLYGALFIVVGYWVLDSGGAGYGVAMMAIGAIGVLAGGATFVSNSPKVKIIQAFDSFLMALVVLGFALQGEGAELMDNPLIGLGLAAFMTWAGFDDLREYEQLSRAVSAHASDAEDPLKGS